MLDVNEIEIVHFERVYFGIKNFDLSIVWKDFATHKRINSIPIEYIEDLKTYFDEIDIIYSESCAPFNWNAILNQIKEDFSAWIEDGAWMFLQDGQDEEGDDDDEENTDPVCAYGEEDGS